MSVGEVGVKPGQCCAIDVERGFQLAEQDLMVSKAAVSLRRIGMPRSEKRRRLLVTFQRAFQCDVLNENQIGKF